MTLPDERRRLVNRMWLIYSIVPILFCFLAILVSWPLGPGYVNEGGITDLRLAVALLALALLYMTVMLGLTLASVQVLAKNLADHLPNASKTTEHQGEG